MSGPSADGLPAGDRSLVPTRGTPVPVDVSRDRRARLVWVEFLIGPVIWFTHFMVVYLVAEAGCADTAGPGLSLFGPPVPTVVTLVATALAVPACLAAAAWAWRRRGSAVRGGAGVAGGVRAGQEPAGGDRPEPAGRASVDPPAALAWFGVLLSLLSALSVLFVGLPALVLPAC